MQYAYTSESGSRVISDHGSDVLNSQSDEKQFKPRLYNSITIEEFIYESWPPTFKILGAAGFEYFDSPITSINCSGGICIYSYEAGNESETVRQHGSSTLLFLGSRRISSFQTIKGKRTGLFRFVSGEESRTWVYYPGLDDIYTEIDWGSITANAGTTSDHGLVSKLTATPVDYGRIYYLGTVEAFGFKKVIGEAQARATNAWVGEGRIGSFGRQTSPAVYGWITDGKVRIQGAADVDFSPALSGRGILPLQGNGHIVFTPNWNGSGILRKFSGSAESITVNPDEKQMLFSFTGELISEKHTESYNGSGFFKNFSSVDEEKVFAHVGSGFIHLRPRKPVSYELGELANLTLEITPVNQSSFGDNTYGWKGITQLGAVLLKDLNEKDHETHTEVYHQEPIVPFLEKDWGAVSGCNNIETITTSGDITGVSTGCIVRVDTGVTARVTSNQTYQVAPSNNQASNFTDYGLITRKASATEDWGHILTNTDLIPGGLFRFDQSDTAGASIQRVPSWVGSGTLRLTGDTVLPVDVAIRGDGNLWAMSGAAVTSTNFKVGEGLFKIGGTSTIGICADLIGEGTFSTFSGAAESLTWNPEERQLLFSIVGGIIGEKHTESYLGSGDIKNLSGGIEKGSYDYVGSGSILTFNKLEEARTYFYNCSSIVEFGEFDYGLLVDPTNAPITTLNTQTISTNTTAPTGVVRVASGNIVGISTGVTYTVPSTQTVPSTYIDYGFVSQYASATNDYGWILGTVTQGMPACMYGTIEISGSVEAKFLPVWNGRGSIRTTGEVSINTSRHYHGSGSIKTVSGSAICSGRTEEGGGLFRITDSAKVGITADIVGDGLFSTFSGAAESLTWNPEERQMLFDFLGEGTYSHTERYVGSGRIRNLATLEAEKGTFDYTGSGSLTLFPRKPQIYELGKLGQFTLDFYSLRNAYINLGYLEFYKGYTNLGAAQLKWLTLEEAHEKHTEVYDNSACFDDPELDYGLLVDRSNLNCVDDSGTISTNTIASSGCIKVAPGTTLAIAPSNTYTIPNQLTVPTSSEDYGSINNFASPWIDYGHILDSTSKSCPFGLYHVVGAAKTHYEPNIVATGYSVSGKAGVSIFGEGDSFWTPPYHGSGLVRVLGVGAEAYARTPYIGSGSLKKFSGAAECVAWNPTERQMLFSFTGATYSLFSLLHPGSGIIRVIGESGTNYVPTIIGSGSLKKFSGAAESITWNPEEKQLLFSFMGELAERKSVAEEGFGTLRLGSAAEPVFFIPKYPAGGLVRIFGSSDTSATRPFIGSGSLKKFSGAAESLTYNPEERQMLFSFMGEGSQSRALTKSGSGSLYTISGAAETVGYSEEGRTLGRLLGTGGIARSTSVIGSGSLKKFSGAAESISFNPDEKQMLFSFMGEHQVKFSANPPEEGSLSRILGEAATFYDPNYFGSGNIRISGQASLLTTNAYLGSGSLKKFSGLAESVSYNPEEKQLLFSFTSGITSEKHSEVYVGQGRTNLLGTAITDYQPSWTGSGTTRLRGDVGIRWVPNNVGEGTLYTFSGSAESVTYNPEEKQLLFSFIGQGSDSLTVRAISEGGTLRLGSLATTKYIPHWRGEGTVRVSGIAKTHWVPHVIGSGILYSFSGAAESLSIAATSIQTIFRVRGEGDTSRTVIYTGSGSFKKFSGSAESVTYNPDERQMLFSFIGEGFSTKTRSKFGQGTIRVSGESTVRFSPVYFGSGTTRVSCEATTTRARDFVGFGSLKKISGAAESITWNPEEKQLLFSFMGEGSKARTSRELSQGGVLTVRGTSGDPLLTFAEQPEVQIAVSGDSYDLRSHAYQGSGRISNVHSADEAFVRDDYKGSGRISLSGIALVQVVVWQPPHTQVWII